MDHKTTWWTLETMLRNYDLKAAHLWVGWSHSLLVALLNMVHIAMQCALGGITGWVLFRDYEILRGKCCVHSSAHRSRLGVIHRETQLTLGWPLSYLQSGCPSGELAFFSPLCVSGEKWALHNCSLRLSSLLGDLQCLPFLSLMSLLFMSLPSWWNMNWKSFWAEKQLDICPLWILNRWQLLFIFFCF